MKYAYSKKNKKYVVNHNGIYLGFTTHELTELEKLIKDIRFEILSNFRLYHLQRAARQRETITNLEVTALAEDNITVPELHDYCVQKGDKVNLDGLYIKIQWNYEEWIQAQDALLNGRVIR